MINIAIVGVGQIGSRHLQAMSNFKDKTVLQVVDPSSESLSVAEKRFFDIYKDNSGRIKLKLFKKLDDLSDPIDLAIIATSADVRARVIKEIVKKKKVKNLILEKVLFQKKEEYFEISKLLQEEGICAWVNCWMRATDFYKKLKLRIDVNKKIEMKVVGSSWGMGCNSIHFIDLFSYITDCDDFNLTDCNLDQKIIESKRSGFKEFSGKLVGENSKGDILSLICHGDGNDPVKIQIVNGLNQHEIKGFDSVVYKIFNGKKESVVNTSIPFQSQRTHKLVDQIIKYRNCDISDYHYSMNHHLVLIKHLMEHLVKLRGEEVEICPIT